MHSAKSQSQSFTTWVIQISTVFMLGALLAFAGPAKAKPAALEEAIFGGGCFWCMEEAFEAIPGVVDVVSGYSGGHVPNPDYKAVSSGHTGHVEVIRVKYDPEQVSYATLLRHFWLNVDPTVKDQQFCDVGEHYRSVIYTVNDTQAKKAKDSLDQLVASKRFKNVYTTVEPAKPFYVAEEYHQDFYKKNPLRYRYYKNGCGRVQRLKAVWGNEKP